MVAHKNKQHPAIISKKEKKKPQTNNLVTINLLSQRIKKTTEK